MDGVLEIDTVLQYVRQAARRFRVPSDAAITQQILLLGDAFYGYRFTVLDFTVIWSAADQTLKVYDHNGRMLEVSSPSEAIEEPSVESIPLSAPQRKVA